MATTDDCEVVILERGSDKVNREDISLFGSGILRDNLDNKLLLSDHKPGATFQFPFAIVWLDGENLLADGYFHTIITVCSIPKPAFTLTIQVDPDDYLPRRVYQLSVVAEAIEDLGHVFNHLIETLACDLLVGTRQWEDFL